MAANSGVKKSKPHSPIAAIRFLAIGLPKNQGFPKAALAGASQRTGLIRRPRLFAFETKPSPMSYPNYEVEIKSQFVMNLYTRPTKFEIELYINNKLEKKFEAEPPGMFSRSVTSSAVLYEEIDFGKKKKKIRIKKKKHLKKMKMMKKRKYLMIIIIKKKTRKN